jgi:carbon monoxide dehydrogenase subunit G
MRIEDRFTVALPLAQAWEVLRDVERIAPCMPGAQLTEIEGDEYRGVVKIKLGAITAQYKGSVHFAEVDEVAHRMVLAAKGRETRGQGNASADVVVTLAETAAGTEVAIETDLTISGKIAQFGRGVLADVSAKLLGDFARCLEDDLAGSDGGGSSGGGGTAPVADLAGDDGADPGMALPEPIGDAADSIGATTEPASGEHATGVETTASAVSGFETTGEQANVSVEHDAGPSGDGPDANGSAASGASADVGSAPPRPSPLRTVTSSPSEPLDLLTLAGPGMAQRALPVALVVDLVLLAVTRRPAVRWLLSAAGTGLVAAVVLGSQPDD